MSRTLAFAATIMALLLVRPADASTSFRGTYVCALDTSTTIRDSAGNSLTIPTFTVKVGRTGRIEIDTPMTFRIGGKTQTLKVEGRGSIKETHPRSEATFSFSLTPSRKLRFNGKDVVIRSKSVSLYRSSSSAYGGGYLTTPFGQASITCATPDD